MYTRVKELRLERKISQITLSTYIGCSQNTISKIEKGEIEPRGSLLMEMASYFGVSSDYILGITDQRIYYPSDHKKLQMDRTQRETVEKILKLSKDDQQVVRMLVERLSELENMCVISTR